MLLVFDLDDTLYDERTFVDSGFRAVAEWLAPQLSQPPGALVARLDSLLDERGRGSVFDDLLADHGVDDPALVSECVRVYRSHEPSIALRPDVDGMLRALAAAGHRLYVVTDGDATVQRRKAMALGLDRLVVDVYPTWEYGEGAAKPSLTCFDLIRGRESASWSDLTYVADDPSKDFVSLNTAGATTVRVHAGRFADAPAAAGYDAQFHVGAVTEVPAVLGLDRAHGG